MIKKGFTIVEMLIYLGLLAGFIAILTGILLSVFDIQLESAAGSAVDHDGRYILARLAYDIRRADAITSPAAAGSTSTTLGLTIAGSPYTYSVSGTDFQLAAPAGTANLTGLDSQISSFSVTRLGNPSGKHSLQITFTLTSAVTSVNQRPQIRNYQTTVDLR